MRNVGGGEIVGFELGLQGGDRCIDEEGRVGSADTTENYVGRSIIVPRCGLREDSSCFGRGREICGDGVETLRLVNSTALTIIRYQLNPRVMEETVP